MTEGKEVVINDVSLNTVSKAMESDTIQKNGASPKSQRVGSNFLNIYKL